MRTLAETPEYIFSAEQFKRIGGEALKKLNEQYQAKKQRELANAWVQGWYFATNGKYDLDPADNPYGEADE